MPTTPGKPRAQGAKKKQRWSAEQKKVRDAVRASQGKAKGAPRAEKPRRDLAPGGRPPRGWDGPRRAAHDTATPGDDRRAARARELPTARWQRARDDRPRAGDRPRERWEDARRARRDDRWARDDRTDRRPKAARPGDRHPRRGRPREGVPATPDADHMEWVARRLERATAPARTGFSDLGLPGELVDALAADGITEPFPIQAATIADALAGRDVLGRARTGSGKTLGFGLPLLARLAAEPGGLGVRAVVLVPTRELALQVADVLAPLAQAVDLSTALVAGGMAYGPQLRAFERGVDVVVATPGRLVDLMEQGAADLSQVAVTVLDEADHMADLGFWPAVTAIVDATPHDGQRLLFSATLDEAVDALVTRYLTDPVTHEVDPETASVGTMTHTFWLVAPPHKAELTARLAGRAGRVLVFVKTQRGADRVAAELRAAGVVAGALHGGLTQGARSRVLAAYRDGSLPVLVATDVAARGIHVDDVGLVLQADPPMTAKDYLHRAGRTARAGGEGTVVSIVLPHQRRMVHALGRHAGVRVDLVKVGPADAAVADLAGPEAVREPVTDEAYAALVAPKPAARAPRPVRRGGPSGRRRR